MLVSDSFHVEELVHPEIVKMFGLNRCHSFLKVNSMPLILTLESLKVYTGNESVVLNDWFWRGVIEGAYINSGARFMCEPIGNNFSSHYGFNTGDAKFETFDVGEIQDHIVSKPHKYPFIKRMENTLYTRSIHGEKGRDWLHIETGVRLNHEEIKVFRP